MKEKFTRTSTYASGGITPDEKIAMDAHAKMWSSRIMRTDPIEKDKIVPVIEGLYEAAGLKKPRVVYAPSPFVMAMVGGFAAGIWHIRKTHDLTANVAADATGAATDYATRVATRDATGAATRVATDYATRDATDYATRDATRAAITDAVDYATRDATDAATRVATRDATWSATEVATLDATGAATDYATRVATEAATRDATWSATRVATRVATWAVTDDATKAATEAGTWAVTEDATGAATRIVTRDATWAATRDATRDATGAAIRVATRDATEAATWAATRDATKTTDDVTKFLLECASNSMGMAQGGNHWSQYDAYLTASRDILGLRLPQHEKYHWWEQAAIHGSWRIMHDEFCIVSDFPELIKTDEQNRPHCETGPSHRWRDGWSIYHWHGVHVPSHWIEDRENLDPAEVLKVENVEQRAAGASIIGWARMSKKLDRKIIDGDPETDIGALVELTLPGLPEPGRFLMAQCPRNGTICEGVPRQSDIDGLPIDTAIAAQAWRDGLAQSEYSHAIFRT